MNPIRQMLVAVSVCAVVVVTGLTLVTTGTVEEQKINSVATQPTRIRIAPTQPAPQLHYYDTVPLDRQLQDYIINQCHSYGVDPAIVMAMIERESDYNADTIGDYGNSFGLMQIQPKWHSERMEKLYCTDLLNPCQNVTVGIDYLAELYKKYDCDYGKALTAYNRGHYAGFVTQYAKSVIENSERIGEYK